MYLWSTRHHVFVAQSCTTTIGTLKVDQVHIHGVKVCTSAVLTGSIHHMTIWFCSASRKDMEYKKSIIIENMTKMWAILKRSKPFILHPLGGRCSTCNYRDFPTLVNSLRVEWMIAILGVRFHVWTPYWVVLTISEISWSHEHRKLYSKRHK